MGSGGKEPSGSLPSGVAVGGSVVLWGSRTVGMAVAASGGCDGRAGWVALIGCGTDVARRTGAGVGDAISRTTSPMDCGVEEGMSVGVGGAVVAVAVGEGVAVLLGAVAVSVGVSVAVGDGVSVGVSVASGVGVGVRSGDSITTIGCSSERVRDR